MSDHGASSPSSLSDTAHERSRGAENQSMPDDLGSYQYDQTQSPLSPVEFGIRSFQSATRGSGASDRPFLGRLARSRLAATLSSVQSIQKLQKKFSLVKSPTALSASPIGSDSSQRSDGFSASTQREIQRKARAESSQSPRHSLTQRVLVWVFLQFLTLWVMDTIVQIIISPTQANHWVFIYLVILAGFYTFTTPFRDQLHRGEMSYFSFSLMYSVWLFCATLYRLPSFSMFGINTQLSISIFLTVLLATCAFLVLFHSFYMLLGLVSYVLYPSFARRKFAPKQALYKAIGALEFWDILISSVTIALFCALTHSHCESSIQINNNNPQTPPELSGNSFYTAVYLMQPLPQLTCPNPDLAMPLVVLQPFLLPKEVDLPKDSSVVAAIKATVHNALKSVDQAYPNRITRGLIKKQPRIWQAMPSIPSITLPSIEQQWMTRMTGDVCRSLSRVPHNSLSTFSLPFALYVDRQPKLETNDYELLFEPPEPLEHTNLLKQLILAQPYSFTKSISMYPEFSPEMAISALLQFCRNRHADPYCVYLQQWVLLCEEELRRIVAAKPIRVNWRWTCPPIQSRPLLMLLAGTQGGRCPAESQLVTQNYVVSSDPSIVNAQCQENTSKLLRSIECRFRPFEPMQVDDKNYSYSSPVWQLWLTLVVIYIINYVFYRSASWALSLNTSAASESYRLQQQRKVRQTVGLESVPTPEIAHGTNPMGYPLGHNSRRISQYDHVGDKPRFLPMVSWFSVTSWDIWQSAFDILVSFKLFLGRFDRRTVISNHVHATSLFDMTNTESLTKGGLGELYMLERQKTRDLTQLLAVQAAAVADLQTLVKRIVVHNRIKLGVPGSMSEHGPEDALEMIDLSPLHSLVDEEALQTGMIRSELSSKPMYDGVTFQDYRECSDLWFDWIADVGDGGDSAYCVSRLLAQPFLDVDVPADEDMYAHVKDLFIVRDSDGSRPLSDPPDQAVAPPEGLQTNAADLAFYPPMSSSLHRSHSAGAHKTDLAFPEPLLESAYLNKTQASPLINLDDIKRNFALVQNKIRRVMVPEESTGTTKKERIFLRLPRARVLVCGGDLAYPNPTNETYDDRFLLPLEYALPPPAGPNIPGAAHAKPLLPPKCASLKEYPGPTAFVLPGNHDWFDGLDCFMRYICHRHWMAGWLLPQRNSYFALALPHGVWLWAIDQGLNADIDAAQFAYFEGIALKMGPNERAIVCSHEPTWLLAWHAAGREPVSLLALLHTHLKGRCIMRLAGDVHQYLRHSIIPDSPTVHRSRSQGSNFGSPMSSPSHPAKTTFPLHCLVSGGGGAFLHPTHPFWFPIEHEGGQVYSPEKAYPNVETSRSITLGNLVKFRKKNWQFDVVAGQLYLAIICSVIPLCSVSDYYTAAPLAFLAAVPQHQWSPGVQVNPIDKLTLLATSVPNTPPFSSQINMQCPQFELPTAQLRQTLELQSPIVHTPLLKAVASSHLNPPLGPYSWLDPPAQGQPTWAASNHWLQAINLLFVQISRHVKLLVSVIISLFARSTYSAFAITMLYVVCLIIVPRPLQGIQRVALGAVHATFHVFTAVSLAIIFEASIELATKSGLVGSVGIHELFNRYRIQEEQMFPDQQALRVLLEQYTFGIYPALIKWVMTFFDVSNFYAITRGALCSSCATFTNLSHGAILGYYAAFFVYFWVLVTPICSFIIGCYLYISLNIFNVHWDEGFSSLRIMHYKSFMRFRIDKKGDIHVFCLGIDRTPKKWIEDSLWWRATRRKVAQAIWGPNGDIDWGNMSYARQRPSRWKPASDQPDKVKIIDYFCVKTDGSTFSAKDIDKVADEGRTSDDILNVE